MNSTHLTNCHRDGLVRLQRTRGALTLSTLFVNPLIRLEVIQILGAAVPERDDVVAKLIEKN